MARKNYQPQDRDKPFPSRLRELMDERGITQEELGKLIGKSRPTVSCYVNGTAYPDLETLAALAACFDTSADYLLGMPNSVRTSEVEKRAVCEYLGLSEEALERIRLLGAFGCLEELLKADWMLSLVQAVGLLRHSVTESALPQTNPTQAKRMIRNCVYDIMEYAQNLADEVSGYRAAEKLATARILQARERYERFLEAGVPGAAPEDGGGD